ncbi:MAG: CoA transferase [Candidatus Hydrogenedentes bacterium]|nr:CoA transferase [Candidatus Hydrogenedentota bacterium]
MHVSVEDGPLSGCRVLELGSMVAGPFCTRLLADFGAEVIKIEPLDEDPVRFMGSQQRGKSLYAASIFRNKHVVSLDLNSAGGQRAVKKLVPKCDFVVENFRPGTLERWGLGYEELAKLNAGIILVRISGFGQTGSGKARPGYGVIGEAVSGLRDLTGEPNSPPPRMAVSLTDYITGLYGAFGALTALHDRTRTGLGQVVDLALYEAAFSFMEPHIPAYSNLGVVACRSGSKLPNNVPNDLFPARGGYVHIAAVSQGLFRRLMSAIGKPELAEDSRFSTALARVENEDVLCDLIGEWTRQFDEVELERRLIETGIPASRIYSIKDIFADPIFREREMLVQVPDKDLGSVTVAGVVPKLSRTPGRIRWAGHTAGADTEYVLGTVAELSIEEIRRLVSENVVRVPSFE